MKRILLIVIASVVLIGLSQVHSASAQDCPRGWVPKPWHGNYYHTAWGSPVALVVPPTAEAQTQWGWGVGNTRIVPICPQFRRAWPGPGRFDRSAFKPTPRWPSDTNQFGAYYVRGPW